MNETEFHQEMQQAYSDTSKERACLSAQANNISQILEGVDRVIASFKRGTSMADLAAMYGVSIRDIEAIVRFAFRMKP